MKNNAKYFRDASAFVGERFSGVDGFANFAGDYTFANGGQNAVDVKQAVASSLPYEIRAVNANAFITNAVLFGSNKNRTAANFGNPAGMTVSSATANIEYVEMLSDSENKNFECGVTYIEVESGSNSALTATWSLLGKTSSGKLETNPVPVKKSPNQQQTDVLEFHHSFEINGYTQITIPIPALTTVLYSFYPAATVAPGRALNGVHATMQYVKPSIGVPQQLALSPAALAALRG